MSISTTYRRFARSFRNSITPPIPRRLQRMIVVASLTALINNPSDYDKALVQKLNTFLNADYKAACQFPMHIRGLIWKCNSETAIDLMDASIKISDLRDTELSAHLTAFVTKWFLDRVPSWLRYGSDALIEYDIRNVLNDFRAIQ